MNTVIWDEGELHTLQLHNFFFYYFLSFWFELQLPKLALVFCAMLVTDPCPTWQGSVWFCQIGLCGAEATGEPTSFPW